MTPESSYAERFFAENLGPKIISIARRVRSSGIVLTQKGAPLQGSVVKDIGDGKQILLEEDLRSFLDKVAKVGGYQENSNYRVIKAFLSATPLLVGSQDGEPAELDDEPIVISPKLPEATNEIIQPEAETTMTHIEEVVVKTDSVGVVSCEDVKPEVLLSEHPRIPGLRLQKDDFFWKDDWGKL